MICNIKQLIAVLFPQFLTSEAKEQVLLICCISISFYHHRHHVCLFTAALLVYIPEAVMAQPCVFSSHRKFSMHKSSLFLIS